MTVKVVYETTACECCTAWIANNDDSGCRDYYEHNHRHAEITKRMRRQIAEEYPGAYALSLVVSDDLVDKEDAEAWVAYGACELCGQSDAQIGYRVVVLASIPNTQPLKGAPNA